MYISETQCPMDKRKIFLEYLGIDSVLLLHTHRLMMRVPYLQNKRFISHITQKFQWSDWNDNLESWL